MDENNIEQNKQKQQEKYWFDLEKHYVYQVYENIANKFDNLYKLNFKENESNRTIYNAWPKVKKFITKLEANSLLADIGCGEGKYLNLNNRIYTIGCDRSSSLCDLANKMNPSSPILICDNLALPFKSDLFDAVISIGVIHHFSTRQRRIQAVQELCRILTPGGKLMIYVWALEQRNRKFNSQDVLVPLVQASSSRQSPVLTQTNLPGLNLNSKHDLITNQSEPNKSNLNETKTKKHSKLSHVNIPFRTNSLDNNNNNNNNDDDKASDSETNLVDNFKLFLARKFKSCQSRDGSINRNNSKETNAVNTVFSHELSKSFDMKTLERYRKILDEHRSVLPKDFMIRQFPYSSCQDTFETCDLEHADECLVTESNSKINSANNEPSNCNLTVPESTQNDHCNNNLNNHNDIDSNKNLMNKRFYHVFKSNELDNLVIDSCPDLIIYDSYYDHGNWCVCAIKKSS